MIIWQQLTWVLQQHKIHYSSFCWRAHIRLERSPHCMPYLNKGWAACYQCCSQVFFLRLTDRTIGESLKKTMTVSLSSPTWSLAFCLLLEITSHSVSVLWFINKYSGARGSLLHLYHLCKAVQSVSLSYKWVILTYVGLTLRSSFYLKISWCYRQNAKWFDYLHCSPLPLSSVNKAKRRLCKAKPEETVTK